MSGKCLSLWIAVVLVSLGFAHVGGGLAGEVAESAAITGGPAGRPHVPLAGEWEVQFVREPGQAPAEDGWETSVRRGSRNVPLVMPRKVRVPGGLAEEHPERHRWGAWFRREVEVPREWSGDRVVLTIGRAMYGVAAYVDGQKAGEIPPYGGQLDLTDLVQPGENAVLRLYCGRLGEGLKSMDILSRRAAEYFRQKDKGGRWLAAPTGVFGLPEEFRLERRPAGIEVEDVWYRTFLRGGARIEPIVRVWSAGGRDDVSFRVSVYESGGDAAVLEKTYRVGEIPAGRSRHHLVVPAAALDVWDIGRPNLYFGQVTVLDGEGVQVDRSNPVRFGVREFWAQGRKLYLNDHPVTPVPSFTGYAESLDELIATGVNMVQRGFPLWFQYVTEDFRKLAAQCDEKGVLLIAGGMTHHELNLSDPELMNDYIEWAQKYYRRHANHPSIVMYGLGINSPGNYNHFGPETFGRTSSLMWNSLPTTRSYQVGRQVDPTRLFYFHGGPCGGDVTSGNWYPNHTPTQEVEDWVLEWSEEGDRPVLTVEALLSRFNVDYQKAREVYATEYVARKIGGAAYEAESGEYRDYIAYRYPRAQFWDLDISLHPLVDAERAETLRRAGRAWRYLGIGVNNWAGAPGSPGALDGQDRTRQAALDLRQTAMAWIGGPQEDFSLKDHNFYAAQTVEKTVLGIHDRHGAAKWQMDWELKGRESGSVVQSGEMTRNVSPFSRVKESFRFQVPGVAEPTDFVLALDVREEGSGRAVAKDAFDLTVFPRPKQAPAAAASETFFVLDPRGETTAWLEEMGVATRRWEAGSAAPGRVLVVGREALRGLKGLPYTAEEVESGLRVVVFEQHCRDLGNIGFRHEDRSPRQVFVRREEHPLAAGLNPEALRDWRGHATLISPGPEGDRTAVSRRFYRAGNRGSVASAIIETPHFGPFETVLDCEFDLSYTPLMRWRHGRGEIVFSQLDLVDRIGREPAADRVALNLIEYLRTPLEGGLRRTAVCLDPTTVERVRGLGFAAAPLPADGLGVEKHLLVVTGGQAGLVAGTRARIQTFVERGGDLLVLYADEELLADGLFGGRVEARPARVDTNLVGAAEHPLLRGAGPQNLHWRGVTDLVKVRSDADGFTPLLDGLAGVLPRGEGRVVFFQVDPERVADIAAAKEADPVLKDVDPETGEPKEKALSDARMRLHRARTRWHVNRLHGILLGNLGVRSSRALAKRLFEVRPEMTVAPVNEWMVLGPFPPREDADGGPLDRKDLSSRAAHRDMQYEFENREGGTTRWFAPNDVMHGLGEDGRNDFGKIYGIREGQAAVALTWIWSTRRREAEIGLGADWWLKVMVNGKQVFETSRSPWTFGINFERRINVTLEAGWNEIECHVASGSNGHILWFQIDNPGDLVVRRQLKKPQEPPENLPAVEELVSGDADPGFRLYSEPMGGKTDPYTYQPW